MYRLSLAMLLALIIGGANAGADPLREAEYAALALKAAKSYLPDRYVKYKPHHNPHEVAASTVAINAHVLLEAYLVEKSDHWLKQAQVAADSLLTHSDVNGDGKIGWGRYWALPGPSGDKAGGNTPFILGCPYLRNSPYDDELYDDARIGHFLVALYDVTKEPKYLDAVRQMVEDTWALGEETLGGRGFAYFKTSGACDRGWHVKNINLLMAIPLAYLARETREDRYQRRAEQIVADYRSQLERRVNGSPAPNLGYYAVETAVAQAGALGSYVERAQVQAPDGSIQCNMNNSSGESCVAHLGLEARSLAVAETYLGRPADHYRPLVRVLLTAMERTDVERCTSERTALGRPRNSTACAAYYCFFRSLESRFDDYCYSRIGEWGLRRQDIILGLFWGRTQP